MRDEQATEKLLAALRAAGKETDGRTTLPCALAFKIAKETGVELAEICRLCDENHIRIAHCQLGCF